MGLQEPQVLQAELVGLGLQVYQEEMGLLELLGHRVEQEQQEHKVARVSLDQ
jgi:hypothetical protein